MSVPETPVVVEPVDKKKQAVVRLVKVAAAAVVAAAAGWLAGPDAANLVGTQNAVLVFAVLTPIISAVEKYLNGPTEPVKTPVE